MADEVTFTLGFDVNKNDSLLTFAARSFQFDMAGANPADNTQIVGTSAENVFVGDAGAGPFVVAINLDAANFVQLGYDATGFVPFVKLNPGEPAAFRLDPARTLQAKADTADCNVRFIIIPA